MSPTSERLREYPSPDESLVAVYAATLSTSSDWTAASLGLTDRRLLCVSEDGEFTTVGYDSLCTIRSHTRTSRSIRGNDYRLLLGGGSFAGALGLGGLVAATTGVLVTVLSLASVGGLVSSVSLYRRTDRFGWETLDAVVERVPGLTDSDTLERYRDRVSDDGLHRMLLIASGCTALLGTVATVLLASSWLVVPALLVLGGGVALVDHAHRHRTELDGFEIVRRHETELSISTDDGRTIHIRSDPADEVDRALSRAAFGGRRSARIISERS